MGNGSVVKHLTGAELEAVERHTGKLQKVGTRGDLVRVPAEFVKFVEGTEEISGTNVASATYNRGLGHAEQAADALKEADDASREEQPTTGTPDPSSPA